MAEAPLTSLVVPADEVQRAETILDRLLAESGAGFAMLLDRSGQIVTSRGTEPGGNLLALGALLAGTFAAAREVARALKDEEFSVFFQQGSQQSALTNLVGGQWLLAVIFDQRTPVGLVKVMARRAAGELAEILARIRPAGGQARPAAVPGHLRTSIEAAIDSLFRD
ncbi:MAG: roadblock/LC7 domain-containing protein [Chloroflexi bacterium]|nr:roadblock/LC7 domain-containing protein [Chloroflexota bacterium]